MPDRMPADRAETGERSISPSQPVALPETAAAGSLADCLLLVSAAGLTRYLCRSHLLYDIDSVNYALAIDHFDPALHQPHPPGYFLYVCAARAMNLLCHDANTALVALSIMASCAAVVLVYLLARNWSGRRAGIFAGAAFLLSPLCWFHGTVALTYIVEFFFSALTGYLCWRGFKDHAGMLVAAGAVLGMAAGFRPSSLVLLGPLWLFSLTRARTGVRTLSLLLLTLTVAAWGIPMVAASGGWQAYFGAFQALWKLVPGKQSFLTALPAMVLARLVYIAAILVLCFGSALLALSKACRANPPGREKSVFAWVWMAPGLLFFTFVFLKFVNSGYLLVVTPPAFAWLGFRISNWYSRNDCRRAFRWTVLGAAAIANACVYLFAPVYCSFTEVRRFEAELTATVAAVRRQFDPAGTLVVGFDSHFLGYRHAGYYLPEFLTVQYPPVPLAQGPRIFAVRNRRTELLPEVAVSQFRRFVLFPLPPGADYRAYMERQQARFPAGVLHYSGQFPRLATGSIGDLHYLFSGGTPETGSR